MRAVWRQFQRSGEFADSREKYWGKLWIKGGLFELAL